MIMISSGIGDDDSPRTALATVDSAVTAPPPNLDQEVDKLIVMVMVMVMMEMMEMMEKKMIMVFRLISCSVVVECDATSAAAFSQAKETLRAKDLTELIRARRVSVQLERPASGTRGSGAEAG